MEKKRINYSLRINRIYDDLKPKEQLLCNYIREHDHDIIHMSITELSEQCNISEASLVRFARKLGYKGFQSMKINIAEDVSEPEKQIQSEIHRTDTVSTLMDKVFLSEKQAIDNTLAVLDPNELAKAVTLFCNAKRLIFYAVGGSGTVALDAQHKFIRIGFLPLVFTDGNIQAMSASILTKNDVVLAISQSGASSAVIDALELAHQAKAKIIVITNYGKSPIIKYSDVCLFTSAPTSIFRSEPLSSRIAELAVIDALFTGVSFTQYERSYKCMIQTRKAVETKKI